MVTLTRLRIGPRVLPRATSFAIWGAAFGCAAYWALQVGNSSQAPNSVAATGFDVVVDAKSVGKVLGQTDAVAPAAQTSSRYDLLGVVRQGNGEAGVALISVDGRPARAIVVGRAVEGEDKGEGKGEVTLTALGARSATLTPKDGAPITLEMPALTSAFTPSKNAPALAARQPTPATPSGQTAAFQPAGQFRNVPQQGGAPSVAAAPQSGQLPGAVPAPAPPAFD